MKGSSGVTPPGGYSEFEFVEEEYKINTMYMSGFANDLEKLLQIKVRI